MEKISFSILIGAIILMAASLVACRDEDEIIKSSTNSIKVTYIANSGYLIETSDHKILIDALFKTRSGMYGSPTPDLCNKIIRGDAPYDNIKALFITHSHEDHFSPLLAKRFLEGKEDRYVICSDITRSRLENTIGSDEFHLYKDQILDITPEIYSSIDYGAGDLNFTVMRLRHTGETEINKNLGYIISMNGINIFHSGDNDGYVAEGQSVNGIEEYSKLNIANKKIDIAIVNRSMFWEKTAPGIDIIKKYIKPEVVVLAHLSKNDRQGELSNVMDSVSENKKEISNVVRLENSLDSEVYEF